MFSHNDLIVNLELRSMAKSTVECGICEYLSNGFVYSNAEGLLYKHALWNRGIVWMLPLVYEYIISG